MEWHYQWLAKPRDVHGAHSTQRYWTLREVWVKWRHRQPWRKLYSRKTGVWSMSRFYFHNPITLHFEFRSFLRDRYVDILNAPRKRTPINRRFSPSCHPEFCEALVKLWTFFVLGINDPLMADMIEWKIVREVVTFSPLWSFSSIVLIICWRYICTWWWWTQTIDLP